MLYKGQGIRPESLNTKWYNLKTKRVSSTNNVDSPIYTVIENFDEDLIGNDNYRFVLMTFKKKKKEGKAWRIPMLSPRWNPNDGTILHTKTNSTMAWANTWWPVSSSKTKWWGSSGVVLSTCGLSLSIRARDHRFAATANKKMLLGVALFRKVEGQGTWGWQRCSNISQVMLFVNNSDEIDTRVIE